MRTCLLLVSLFSASALAAEKGAAGVLNASDVYGGRSDRLVSPAVVVVADGKITAVGSGGAIPADATIIDLGDATILPGFIDAHTHLSHQRSPDWKQDRIDWLEESVAEQALIASEYARKTLMAGFTTIRDVGGQDFIDGGLRNAIRKGKIAGPRMLVPTKSMGATGAHWGATGYRDGRVAEESPAAGGGR